VGGGGGFVYLISRLGVTGARARVPEDLGVQVARGARRHRAAHRGRVRHQHGGAGARDRAAGGRVVVGSALVEALAAGGPAGAERLVRELAQAARERAA